MESFFTGGNGDKYRINNRVNELKDKMKDATENGKKIAKDRLARLTGRMAKIMCGGNNELDIFENRDRLVDGLNAVKNAIKNVKIFDLKQVKKQLIISQ